jgi:hypothetical protein
VLNLISGFEILNHMRYNMGYMIEDLENAIAAVDLLQASRQPPPWYRWELPLESERALQNSESFIKDTPLSACVGFL